MIFYLSGKWYDNLFYQSVSEIGIYIISMITILCQQNYKYICYIVGARDGQWIDTDKPCIFVNIWTTNESFI